MNWYDDDQITQEYRDEWRKFLDTLPEPARTIAARFDPWTMYRLTTTNQRCQVLAFADDGTVRIYAENEFLGPITGVQVFGIDPETLVPWDDSVRPKWIVEEIPGGQNLGNGYVTGPGVSFTIGGYEVTPPEGGWSTFKLDSIGPGKITLKRN